MTIYYIDGTLGSESNDGLSISTPKKDYSSSIGVADGDIVRLACNTEIQLTIANVATGNYTIESYGIGAKPRLIFPDYATAHIFANAAAKGSIFTMRGIRCERLPHSNPLGDNVGCSSIGGETVICEDCEMIGQFQHGIRLGWGDYSRVANNTVQGALNCGIYAGLTGKVAPSFCEIIGNRFDTPDATNDCITLHDGSTGGYGNKIVGNECFSGVENCIDTAAAFINTYIGFNTLHGGPLNGTSGSGNSLIVCTGVAKIEGNVFDSYNTVCLLFSAVGASGSVVQRNLFLGPTIKRVLGATGQMVYHSASGTNIKYINNTFISRCIENPGASMFTFNSQTPTGVFKNNIVVKSALDPYSAMFWIGNTGPVGEFNNNIMVMPALGTAQYCGKTWSSFNSTFSAHATNSEETLTSPLDNRYRPLLGSSAKGMGAVFGSTCDPAGVYSNIPPSIGAYEYPIARTSRV